MKPGKNSVKKTSHIGTARAETWTQENRSHRPPDRRKGNRIESRRLAPDRVDRP